MGSWGRHDICTRFDVLTWDGKCRVPEARSSEQLLQVFTLSTDEFMHTYVYVCVHK